MLLVVIDLVVFASVGVGALLDLTAVAVDVYVEVLIQLQHAPKAFGLFFDRMRGNIKPVVDGHLVVGAVILVEAAERFGHFGLVENLFFKLLLVERLMGLEVFGRAVEHVDLLGLAYFMLPGDLFFYELFGHVQKFPGRVIIVVAGFQVQERVFPVPGLGQLLFPGLLLMVPEFVFIMKE